MIKIYQPYIFTDGAFAYLKARIDISSDTAQRYVEASHVIKKVHWRVSEDYPPRYWEQDDTGLWFAVPVEYKDYLCQERSDAFVVAMLWYAMVTGSDIESVAPVTESLFINIQQLLIPALCREEEGRRPIRIICPTVHGPYPNAGAVGTGMSCGVDSMFSLQVYIDPSIPEHHRLTHLTYYNMGAIFHPNRSEKKQYSLEEFYETTDRMSEEKRENARKVAELAGLRFVYVKSNLDKDYYRGAYGHTGVYRNCAMTLALQGLFAVYYNSSGGWPDMFHLCLTEGSAQYEKMLLPCLSTDSLHFLVSDYVTRIEKTKGIADNPLAQQFLDVCFCFNNCGKCSKCRRTLITLDLFDKVDLFHGAFDTEAFKKDRVNAYAWLLKEKDGDASNDDAIMARAVYRLAVEKGKIPVEAYKKYRRIKLRGRLRNLKNRIIKFI